MQTKASRKSRRKRKLCSNEKKTTPKRLRKLQRELDIVGNEAIHTGVQLGIPLDLLERLGRCQGYIGSRYFNLYDTRALFWYRHTYMLSYKLFAVSLGK
jgi:hypothetical protein